MLVTLLLAVELSVTVKRDEGGDFIYKRLKIWLVFERELKVLLVLNLLLNMQIFT